VSRAGKFTFLQPTRLPLQEKDPKGSQATRLPLQGKFPAQKKFTFFEQKRFAFVRGCPQYRAVLLVAAYAIMMDLIRAD
jgi:hypothetical protein